MKLPAHVKRLLDLGVKIQAPESTWVDPDIPPGHIAPGAVIHPGCRLRGALTTVGRGCILGEEAPLTVENCQLDVNVELRGGYVSGSVFMEGVALGSAAHVRPGTLMEEHASGGHGVGLKQTVLMPYVTLGSLINFCDCLMAGGTDRHHHSEVGSSFVHFNFTPHQDKTTASLIGDVPRGVMLDQDPIFLGGQGGLVGPIRIEYGTLVAAGTVCRRDITEPGHLVFGDTGSALRHVAFTAGQYGDVTRTVSANLAYIGNLLALHVWYRDFRRRFTASSPHASCVKGAIRLLSSSVDERVRRLDELAEKLPDSIARGGRRRGRAKGAPKTRLSSQEDFIRRWPDIRARLLEPITTADTEALRARFVALSAGAAQTGNYLPALRSLSAEARQAGTRWLQSIVDSAVQQW